MANAQVILREKIAGLGAESDVVKVRAGYARNYLVPNGKAYEATKGNLRHIENLKAARARREAEELEGAQAIATKISKLRPKFVLELGQGGSGFGSVTSIDVSTTASAGSIAASSSRNCSASSGLEAVMRAATRAGPAGPASIVRPPSL